MEAYSVLMTIYKKDNCADARAGIDSMLAQTVLTDDFVMVCDGPLTEELDGMLREYEKAYPEIFRVCRLEKNVGLGAALRHGVTLCKNELVARMDNDDLSRPERCEMELKYLEDHPEVAMVGAHVSEFDEDPAKPLRIKEVPVGKEAIERFSRRRNPFNHSTVLFRKSAVLAAGNYSEMRTNQDVDLWVRMLRKGHRCENLDEVLVDFRFDANTLQRRKDWKNSKLLIEVWKSFRKEGYCSYGDYLFVKWMQIAIFVMPKGLLNWVYDHLR